MNQALNQLDLSKVRKRIAVIEDDESIHGLIRSSLELALENVEFLKFRNAREAIYELWEKEALASPKVDLFFLDIFLDEKTNGIDVLEYCQFVPENVPIVIMSSNFDPENVGRISQMKTGSRPIFLQKPFAPLDVVHLTQWILKD